MGTMIKPGLIVAEEIVGNCLAYIAQISCRANFVDRLQTEVHDLQNVPFELEYWFLVACYATGNYVDTRLQPRLKLRYVSERE